MKYSYSKLKGKIAEVFGTQERFAQAIGISPAALSARLNNITGFTHDEIARSCATLGIPATQISLYFFTHKVQEI